MEWTQTILYVSVGMLALVLLCWAVNMFLVFRGKKPNMLLSRVMYLLAIAAVVLISVRSGVVYSEKTMLAADLVVLVCIIVSYVRLERTHKYGEAEPGEDGETPAP